MAEAREPVADAGDAVASTSGALATGLKKKYGQVVLALQGGGAFGAHQVGVYQTSHEAGIELDWVIGTSIGANNRALIAGIVRRQII